MRQRPFFLFAVEKQQHISQNSSLTGFLKYLFAEGLGKATHWYQRTAAEPSEAAKSHHHVLFLVHFLCCALMSDYGVHTCSCVRVPTCVERPKLDVFLNCSSPDFLRWSLTEHGVGSGAQGSPCLPQPPPALEL